MSHIQTHLLSKHENERLCHLYSTHKHMGQAYIRTSPGNCIVTAAYEKYKDRVYNLQLRRDDVFILCWGKNGTTWTQEMAWCIQNDCDFQAVKTLSTNFRVPFLEMCIFVEFVKGKVELPSYITDSIEAVEKRESPRVVKSHLRYCLLPPKILDQCKVITCIRNPKDTLVLLYLLNNSYISSLLPVKFGACFLPTSIYCSLVR